MSSTFEDLKDERNALQEKVFPELVKLCATRGARFQAIDLRWGVREEAGLDHRTMEICKAEINRCKNTGIKPNFIVLLGDRYGWQPLPAKIIESEFQKVRSRIIDAKELVEVETWYDHVDENAVPPRRILKPREGVYKDRDEWKVVEEDLHRVLQNAAHKAGLPEADLIKYDASATHQEILAGLEKPEDREHVFGFLREPYENPFRDLLPKENVHKFEAGDLTTLCKDVEQALRKVIETEVAGFESIKPLQQEQDAHDRFAKECSKHFVGRTDVLEAIKGHLSGDERRPLVVHGPSGSGKSAILAKSSLDHPGIRRFIGATPSSSSGLTLVQSLCEELGERYGQTGDVPATFNEISVIFQDRLQLATPDLPLILYIDAVDQLNSQDPAVDMNWLPRELPAHCRVVLTTIDIPAALSGAKSVAVESFSKDEAGATLNLWLRDAKRTLQEDQREKLLTNFKQTGLPLYLKLAFEEARLWRSFDPLDKCVLGDGLPGIIDRLFSRLKMDANHGEVLVDHALGYLTAARYGLAEDEILAVLAANDDVWTDFERTKKHNLPQEMLAEDGKAKRRLPAILWSRLSLDLEPYLTERSVPGGITVSFYHQQLAQRVSRDKSHHAELAKYFGKQSHWLDAEKPNQRKTTELVRQQVGAELLDEAITTLTDLDFVSAKCAAELVFDLQDDYREVIAVLPEAQEESREDERRKEEAAQWVRTLNVCAGQKRFPKTEEIPRSITPWTDEQVLARSRCILDFPTYLDRLEAFASHVNLGLYALNKFGLRPGFVVQNAINRLPRGPVHSSAKQLLPTLSGPLLIRHWSARDVYNPTPAQLMALEGHQETVYGVGLTADGQFVVSASRDSLRMWSLRSGVCLRVMRPLSTIDGTSVTADGRMAINAGYKNLEVWNTGSGQCVRLLECEDLSLRCVSVGADGRLAVSGGARTPRLWNTESGQCLLVLEGHTGGVQGVQLLADQQRIVSASRDHSLRVWDANSGECLHILRGHSDIVWGVTVSADGRQAVSASADKTLRVWDMETSDCLRVLEGHTDRVQAVSMTADGLLAVSAGDDKTLRVWNVKDGKCLRVLEAHSAPIFAVVVMPDGRRAVSAGDDRALRVWDLERGTSLIAREHHHSRVMGLSVTADGLLAVSSSGDVFSPCSDNTVRVWDVRSGECLRTLEGHIEYVPGVDVTADGRRVVSASADKTLRVWDLETGECLRVLEGHTDKVNGVSVSENGRWAASAGRDRLRVWDLESGECARTLPKGGWVTTVAITANGSRALTSCWPDRHLQLWDLTSGECLCILEGHTDLVNDAYLMLDGRRAVSASRDCTLRVWELETGECIQVMRGHSGPVNGVRTTVDGRWVVSGSDDGTLRVWALETGACEVLVDLASRCSSVAVTCRNRVLAGTEMGEVLFFDFHVPR